MLPESWGRRGRVAASFCLCLFVLLTEIEFFFGWTLRLISCGIVQFYFNFFNASPEDIFPLFLERAEGREEGREKKIHAREKHQSCLLYVPKLRVGGCPGILPSNWGSHEPCLDEIKPTTMCLIRIEPATLWLQDGTPTNWATWLGRICWPLQMSWQK